MASRRNIRISRDYTDGSRYQDGGYVIVRSVDMYASAAPLTEWDERIFVHVYGMDAAVELYISRDQLASAYDYDPFGKFDYGITKKSYQKAASLGAEAWLAPT